MSTMRLFLICFLAVLFEPVSKIHAQGNAFIYQGLLTESGAPANGNFDMIFNTYAAVSDGTPLTSAIGSTNVSVDNGLFTIRLDFGFKVFTGPARWLEIAVRPAGSPVAYTVLAPRQPITPTPYAISAGNLTGVVSPNSIAGEYTNLVLFSNPINRFTGDGARLTALNATNINAGVLGVNHGGTGASTPSDARASLGAAARGPNADITSLSALSTPLSIAQGGTGANTGSNALVNLGAASLSTSNSFSGVNVLSNSANRFVGTFTGNGSGLSDLDANNITAGVLGVNSGGTGAGAPAEARVSLGAAARGANADITSLSALSTPLSIAQGGTGAGSGSNALVNLGAASLSTSNIFSGVNVLSNAANQFVGTFAGDGSALAALNANNISAGTVPSSQLAGTYSSALNFNNAANSFSGGFAGNGSGLTNVDATSLGGLTASEFWQLGGNAGTTAALNFLGTADDEPFELRVMSTRAFRIEPNTNGSPNLIGGSPVNLAATGVVGATIAGGGANAYSGLAYTNRVSADFGTVSGGYGNASTGIGAGVGGGSGNVSGGHFATVPGGSDNLAMGDYSYAAGQRAHASDTGTFVWADATDANFTSTAANQFLIRAAGGVGINTNDPTSKALAINGAVGISGGHTLEFGADRVGKHPDAGTIGYEALTPDALDIVGAGTNVFSRKIKFWAEAGATFNGTGTNPAITLNNTVDEPTAMAFAAPFSTWRVGQNKPPDAPGAFDSFFIYQQNAGATRLLITSDGKVGLGTNSPVHPLHLANGAYCTAGGVWTSVSDRNAKTAFAPVNAQDVLAKVAELPVLQWRYRVEDDAVKHIGPTAQDFHAAFGLGESSLAIGSVDADGVALAAIQGLIGLLNEREAENRALATKARELEKRLDTLESAMAHSQWLRTKSEP